MLFRHIFEEKNTHPLAFPVNGGETGVENKNKKQASGRQSFWRLMWVGVWGGGLWGDHVGRGAEQWTWGCQCACHHENAGGVQAILSQKAGKERKLEGLSGSKLRGGVCGSQTWSACCSVPFAMGKQDWKGLVGGQ